MLCPEHKAACRLADGSPLFATLAQATPPDSPLEGSLLGWLYNPVFVTDRTGVVRKGWADFAGGGVAVHEDWCRAEQFFDFWLLSRPDGIALLQAAGRSSSTDVPSVLRSLEPAARLLLAPVRDMWLRAAVIRQRHQSLGRWPESFDELQDLLSHAGHPSGCSHDDADFMRHLAHLATRVSRHAGG